MISCFMMMVKQKMAKHISRPKCRQDDFSHAPTCRLSTNQKLLRMILDSKISKRSIDIEKAIGHMTSFHCVASGKAMLSSQRASNGRTLLLILMNQCHTSKTHQDCFNAVASSKLELSYLGCFEQNICAPSRPSQYSGWQ